MPAKDGGFKRTVLLVAKFNKRASPKDPRDFDGFFVACQQVVHVNSGSEKVRSRLERDDPTLDFVFVVTVIYKRTKVVRLLHVGLTACYAAMVLRDNYITRRFDNFTDSVHFSLRKKSRRCRPVLLAPGHRAWGLSRRSTQRSCRLSTDLLLRILPAIRNR